VTSIEPLADDFTANHSWRTLFRFVCPSRLRLLTIINKNKRPFAYAPFGTMSRSAVMRLEQAGVMSEGVPEYGER